MTVIADLQAQGQSLLVDQFQNQPRIAAFLAAFSAELQEIEYAFQQLKYLNGIRYGQGVALDIIGDALQQRRASGQMDSDYRNSLRIAVMRNCANGSANAAIGYVVALTGCGTLIYATGSGLQTYFTHNGNVVPNLPALIRDIAPVGIGTINVNQPGDPPGFWEQG